MVVTVGVEIELSVVFVFLSLFKYFTAVTLKIIVNTQNCRIQKFTSNESKMKSNTNYQFYTILKLQTKNRP